jgi:nucleoside-diphosphate-sugar epimerase
MVSRKRIFITGSDGFVASRLIAKLVDEYEVFALLRPVTRFEGVNDDVLKSINIRYGDLTDFLTMGNIVKEVSPNIILHLGARTPVSFSFEQPMDYQNINYMGTVNLVTSALKLPKLEKFVFASTMESYGWQPEGRLIKENAVQSPASPYAVSKVAAEHYIKMAGEAFGLPYIIMRACNTYGGKPFGTIIEYLANCMLTNKVPNIGTPDAVRDFIHVDDHVGAYMSAVGYALEDREQRLRNIKADPNHYAFNFGWGLQLRIRDIAGKLQEITGYCGEIKFGFPADYPKRVVVEPYLSLDAAKARKVLGWSPKTDIDAGLRRTIDFWKERLKT